MKQEFRGSHYFVTGGALSPDSDSYIVRAADDQLFQLLKAGRFGYVLTGHRMGKSSLMNRTARRLQAEGISTAKIILIAISADVSVERLFVRQIKRLTSELNLPIDADAWCAARIPSDPAQLLLDFFKEVVLAEVEGPVVIFIDQIDASIIELDFFEALFKVIKAVYDGRDQDEAFKRLTFSLLGVITYDELLKGRDQLPISDSQKVELVEFSWDETRPFQKQLQAALPKHGALILRRIFHWTNGHPYLTQDLCGTVIEVRDEEPTDDSVDMLVERLFLSPEARNEFTLQYIRNNVLTSRRRRQLLTIYQQVLNGQEVAEDKQSSDQNHLKLWGLVRAERGVLKVRNEICRHVFDSAWIKANIPLSPKVYIGAAAAVVVLLLAGAGFFFYQQSPKPVETEAAAGTARPAGVVDERLTALAGQFSQPGREAEARQMFYEELSAAEQLALFEAADPVAAGPELVTVVKGVYSDPRLHSEAENNGMLQAMIQPLSALEGDTAAGSDELRLELEKWLEARELYAQGEYEQAIEALNMAIEAHDSNPGTHFDRALAYAGYQQPDAALMDFAATLALDERWGGQVRHALVSNPELYSALSNGPGEYQALGALVFPPTVAAAASTGGTAAASTQGQLPTATSTATHTPVPPTATHTPSPSPTATSTAVPATATHTPAPPTATRTPSPAATATSTTVPPTATATPRPATAGATASGQEGGPTATATRRATATPAIPSGTFKLLSPLTTAERSYGPTEFEWQWSGALPPDTGFEVRVWREGEFPAGAHNAVLDNQNGSVIKTGSNSYRLSTDVKDAYGVKGRSGEYLWTVALVKISPEYADLGQQAEPASFRLDVPGSGGGGDGDGGGVVID